MTGEDPARTIARLRARVARLEQILAERSRQVRTLARGACAEDLEALSRAAAGLPPLVRSDVGSLAWKETTRLRPADVEVTMGAIWRAAAPFHGADDE